VTRLTERIGHADQVALVTGERTIDVRVYRGIDLRLHADRGFDVGAAWFRGFPLAWISSAGEGGRPAGEWREAWGGGLLTTCGLDNVGAPSEGFGLHGTYTFLPARNVSTQRSEDEVVCSATIDDPRGLRVERTIRTRLGEGRVELTDRTVNVADHPLEALVLYHVNLGWPVWDTGARLESDADEVVPRDADAAGHSWAAGPEPEASPERVWEHVGASWARIVNDEVELRVTVESELPRLWQWIDPVPGVYALGIEPANCSVLGRAHERVAGHLPMLEPGAERTTGVVIRAEVI